MPHGSPLRPSTPHHSPHHSSNSPKRSPNVSRDPRLSIIAEDGDLLPAPLKTHHRPFSRKWNYGEPPRHSYEKPPPIYSAWDVTGPKGEKLVDVWRNNHVSSRGGWKRIFVIVLVLVAILVALITGLVLGLRNKNQKRYRMFANIAFQW